MMFVTIIDLDDESQDCKVFRYEQDAMARWRKAYIALARNLTFRDGRSVTRVRLVETNSADAREARDMAVSGVGRTIEDSDPPKMSQEEFEELFGELTKSEET